MHTLPLPHRHLPSSVAALSAHCSKEAKLGSVQWRSTLMPPLAAEARVAASVSCGRGRLLMEAYRGKGVLSVEAVRKLAQLVEGRRGG